jgi:hypothetical protein
MCWLWLLFIALIVAAALIYMRVAKPEIWTRWKNGKHLPYERKERPRIKKSALRARATRRGTTTG